VSNDAAGDKNRVEVKASVDLDHQVNFVDLFVDHTGRNTAIDIVPNRAMAFADYLRDLLKPITCPICNSPQVKRSSKASVKEWLLKFSGRKIFYCTNCHWTEIAKVQKWDWEVAIIVAICLSILVFASIKWIIH
jgi:hypothetical protein